MNDHKRKTTVGAIDSEVLAFTAGEDYLTDRALVRHDCLGTAAHVRMLAAMPCKPPVLTKTAATKVIKELNAIIEKAVAGTFHITLDDQDVHLAVERALTDRLGTLGKKVHTGRSRNDQSALDLRLYARDELLGLLSECEALTGSLLKVGRKHTLTPMVGRTHRQPAMPSSVGLWASAHAESLLEDAERLRAAYRMNNRCPLGAAASYGVPLPLDRENVAAQLGFERPIHNTLYAIQARGKNEAALASELAGVMGSLQRLAEDLLMFSLPEFGYFSWPSELGTGSSIMPQKNNPDVLELTRARAAKVRGLSGMMAEIAAAQPSGYNRELQESKAPFIQAFEITRSTLRCMRLFIEHLRIDKRALKAAFTGEVFATDRALELVVEGTPFREAYRRVKEELDTLDTRDPVEAIRRKTHTGAPGGIDWDEYRRQTVELRRFVRTEDRRLDRLTTRLMGKPLPNKRFIA